MLAILYYCLKVIICSGVLSGYYLLALRNNRFHQWNRYYLLAAVMVAFTLPLLRIPVVFGGDSPLKIYNYQLLSGPDLNFTFVQKQEHFQVTLPLVLWFIYSVVALSFFGVIIKNLIRIRNLKFNYPDEIINGVHFYTTQEPGTPFSFFKNIFWDSSITLSTEKGQQMLRHEMTHVHEKHSIDKVAMEVLIAVAWWNPFLYYIRKELSIIHEFIADQKASAGDAKLQYASLLLMKAMGSKQYALGNPFFHSQLKRRLFMLTTIKNPKFSYVRRLMVLPLVALSLVLFSFKYKEINDTKKAGKQKQQPTSPALTAPVDQPIAVHGFYQDSSKKKGVIIVANKMYKGSAVKNITPTSDLKGAVIKTADGNTYFLNRKEAQDAFGITINDNGWTAPKDAKLIAYDHNGVPPDTYDNSIVVPGKELSEVNLRLHDSTGKPIVSPLYIIDGKEMDDATMKQLDAVRIKSIDILKGNDATAKYGDKGKNGVLVITTKNALPDNVLYIIDGVESTKEREQALDPKIIESINVLKDEDAAKTYGDKGKNGVVVITTKLATNEVTMPEAGQSKDLADVVVIGYGAKPEHNVVFTKVEEPASFPGGISEWKRYLERNLTYPEAAQKNKTQGTVRVQMTVDKEGNITRIKALNDPGNGLADEALRVIKKGPKWVPAKQNGKPVTYQFVQTLTFQLQ